MTDTIDEAEVVIVGGGIIGCSIAYHLCRLGLTDVLVLERGEPAGESTARAAGLVLHASSDRNVVRMVSRTRAAIAELAAEFQADPGFRPVGSLHVFLSEAGAPDAAAAEALLREEGVPTASLDAAEAERLCPWLDPRGAARITLVAADGYVDGARLATSYASAARRLGARLRRGVAVEGILRAGDRAAGVVTSDGAIRSDRLVVAGGAWSIALLHAFGWGMPAAPVRSHYWITAPDGNGPPERPNVLLRDLRAYFRSEVGGLVFGFQEARSQTYDPLELPATTEAAMRHDETAELDLLIEHANAIRPLVPGIDQWRFAHHVAGLSSYTPDGRILLGRVPGVADLFLAGGCCGSGIAMSGGIGSVMAQMIQGIELPIDASSVDPGRFGVVDPVSAEFRERCAAARSGKSRGRVGAAAPSLPAAS